MSFLPGMRPVPFVSGSDAATISFTAASGSGTDTSSYTFSALAIGSVAASGTRHIIAAVLARGFGAVNISAVTIGGVSATQIFSTSWTTNSDEIGFWIAAVPTGTTADVVVTTSATSRRCCVYVFRCTGLITPTTAADSDTDLVNAATQSYSIDIPAGGIAVGVGMSNASLTTNGVWSGLTDTGTSVLFEAQACGGSLASAAAQTVSSTVAWTGSVADTGIAVISLR